MERWFLNLPKVGNVGAASAFLMLEELFNSDKLKAGEKILVMVPESARFSSTYMLLTVV
jgi:3-oxoacyl-[acyl-carrier-protein] synthase-3